MDQRLGLEGILVIEPGEQGLAARMLFTEGALVIETDDGDRHCWYPDTVTASSYDTRTTQLELDGTTLFFEAADPLDFADRLRTFLATHPKREKRKRRSELAQRPPQPSSDTEQSPDPAGDTFGDQSTAGAPPSTSQRGSRQTHEHKWTSQPAGAGITRRICAICRHVSIDLVEAHVLQGDPAGLRTLRR